MLSRLVGIKIVATSRLFTTIKGQKGRTERREGRRIEGEKGQNIEKKEGNYRKRQRGKEDRGGKYIREKWEKEEFNLKMQA